MTKRKIVPFHRLKPSLRSEVETIYKEAFPPEERMPFQSLCQWVDNPGENLWMTLWTLLLHEGRETPIGLSVFGYLPEQRFGYLAYLAIRRDQRGLGHGKWLFSRTLEAIYKQAIQRTLTSPRLVFWEVRDPSEANDEEEQRTRVRRIHFYERLGGTLLPVGYTCPPISDGFPPIPYLLMIKLYPPKRPVTRQDALEVIRTGLIDINQAPPESHWVTEAIQALEAAWPVGPVQ